MAGPDSTNNNRRDGDMANSPLGELARNPWMILVMALVGGGTSGTMFGRPDPFTGAMGRELEARIEKLENAQSIDESMREGAKERILRLRELEARCAVNERELQNLYREFNRRNQ